MALSADFDTPLSASGQVVNITGNIPAQQTENLAFQITVSRIDTSVPSYFYASTRYYNSLDTPYAYSGTMTIAILPAVLTPTEAVSASVLYSSFGSSIALL